MADNNDVEMSGTAPQPTGGQSSRSKYERINDPEGVTAGDSRNALLVVAALISAATFAAGLNPPGGVWQADATIPVQSSSNSPGLRVYAGKSVLAAKNLGGYKALYFLNAAAFSSANVMIIYLVHFLPYFPEIWGAMFCMSATYGVAISAVTPADFDNRGILWFAMAVPHILRGLVELWKKLRKAAK